VVARNLRYVHHDVRRLLRPFSSPTACRLVVSADLRRVEVTPVSSEVVRYRVDDETVAEFEIEPLSGFRPAGAGDIAGQVWDSAGPAVEAAMILLERVKKLGPDAVQVKFGVKVTGTVNWLVAKAASEGNFEITLCWQPGPGAAGAGHGGQRQPAP
jgi:hypothetical protein